MTRRENVGESSRSLEEAGPAAERLRPSPVFQPDNSCCFCLSLKSGTAIISILHSLFYLGLIIWSVEFYINQSDRDTLSLTERAGGREKGEKYKLEQHTYLPSGKYTSTFLVSIGTF